MTLSRNAEFNASGGYVISIKLKMHSSCRQMVAFDVYGSVSIAHSIGFVTVGLIESSDSLPSAPL